MRLRRNIARIQHWHRHQLQRQPIIICNKGAYEIVATSARKKCKIVFVEKTSLSYYTVERCLINMNDENWNSSETYGYGHKGNCVTRKDNTKRVKSWITILEHRPALDLLQMQNQTFAAFFCCCCCFASQPIFISDSLPLNYGSNCAQSVRTVICTHFELQRSMETTNNMVQMQLNRILYWKVLPLHCAFCNSPSVLFFHFFFNFLSSN